MVSALDGTFKSVTGVFENVIIPGLRQVVIDSLTEDFLDPIAQYLGSHLRRALNYIANVLVYALGDGGGGFPQYAQGGVAHGGLAIVGEHGRELVNFGNSTARVFPHGMTEGILNGLGGVPQVVVNAPNGVSREEVRQMVSLGYRQAVQDAQIGSVTNLSAPTAARKSVQGR